MSDQLKKPYQTVTSVYVLLIFTVYLLFFDRNGLAAISKAKMLSYYALTLTYIAAIVFLLILHGAQRKLKRKQLWSDLKQTPAAAWLIALYLLFTLISAFLSDYSTVWLGVVRHEGALTISLYCVSFLLVCRFFRPAQRQLYLFAAGASVFCVICVLQLRNINIFGLYPLAEGMTCAAFNTKFIGTIGNIDFASSFLCIAIPIFWCGLLRGKGTGRYLLLVPLLLCLYVLWSINVAAGYLGILVGTLLSLPVVLPVQSKTRRILWISVAVLFFAAIGVIYFVKLPQKELAQLHNLLHGHVKDSYGTGRMYIWRRTLRAVPSHLWFGTGPDTMVYAAFSRQEVYASDGTLQYIRSFDAAHNEYLTILYHQGIFAFLAYFSALCVTFVQWLRRAKENAAAAILGAAVLCYCLQAFFNISQLITSPFFWCAFAMLAHVLNAKNEPRTRRKN